MIAVASGPGKTITMGSDQPIVAIGERINPSGKKKLAVVIAAGVTWPTLALIKMRQADLAMHLIMRGDSFTQSSLRDHGEQRGRA
jgi:hypothetical protein